MMRIVIDLQGAQTASRTRGIGRYTMALTTALIRNGGDHEVVLALNGLFPETIDPIREAFRHLLPRDRIRVWEAPGPILATPGNDARRQRAELVYEAFLASLDPDIVHVSSLFEGFVDDAATSVGAIGKSFPTSVQLYDLIPLHRPETFLTPNPAAEVHYRRKLDGLAKADLILAISAFTAMDAKDRLSLEGKTVVDVSAACDPAFRRLPPDEPGIAALRRRLRLERPFVLTTGTLDPHKNLDGLFAAVAHMPKEELGGRPVVLPGKFAGRQLQMLGRLAQKAGLPSDTLVLAGYLSDEDLVRLYNCCDLMVLPSLDEGFGLPALEAMACGAPTIGSNAASIPEIIGRADALFDPADPDDMARLIARGLKDEDFRSSLRISGLERAATFSWDETARRALSAMEATVAGHRNAPGTPPTRAKQTRKTLALVVAGSDGLAQASSFRPHYDLTLIADGAVAPPSSDGALPVRTTDWLRENAADLDRVAYILGNTPADDFMIPLLTEIPGTVLLDTLDLGPSLSRLEAASGDGAAWAAALYEEYGYGAVRARFQDPEAAGRDYPVSLDVLRKARGVIVHSDDMLASARERLGAAITRDWLVVPIAEADTGSRHAAAIETAWQAGVAGLVDDIVALDQPLTEVETIALSATIAASFPRRWPTRQLLLDVSHTVDTNIRTGIQRVVRALLLALLEAPPPGFRVEPVYLERSDIGWRYRYARSFTLGLLGCPGDALEDEILEPAAGDVLFHLDLSGEHLIQATASGLLADLRRQGLSTYATMYDVLPVLIPHRFPPGTQAGFEQWLRATAMTDGVICISAAVAEDYRRWVAEAVPDRSERIEIGWFHLGADIDNSAPTRGLPGDAGDVLAALSSRPTFLMVGTIEPRKGHLQALRAVERLWASGVDVNLVVVGAQGWAPLPEHLRSTIPEIVAALRNNPELGRRLFWLEGISDEYLENVYAAATCLLVPSEGEGFGLPLIEAARHGVPILARDLPIFREVAGDHAAYFEGASDAALAEAITAWLALHRDDRHPRSGGMPWATWRESAGQFMRFLAAMEGLSPDAAPAPEAAPASREADAPN